MADMPDLTQPMADARGSMDEAERALRALAKSALDADKGFKKLSGTSMNSVASSSSLINAALSSAAAKLDLWSKATQAGLAKMAEEEAVRGELTPALKAQKASLEDSAAAIAKMEGAAFLATGVLGGLYAALKIVSSQQAEFNKVQRENIYTMGAAGSASKALSDDLFRTQALAGQWGMSVDELNQTTKGLLATNSSFGEDVEGFGEGTRKGLQAFNDMMLHEMPKTGMSFSSQAKVYGEELRKGKMSIQGFKEEMDNLSAGRQVAGVSMEFYVGMVQDVSASLRVLGKTTNDVEKDLRNYAQAVYQGTVSLETMKDLAGGFEKKADLGSMMKYGLLASGLGGKGGAGFTDVIKKGGSIGDIYGGMFSAMGKTPEEKLKLSLEQAKTAGFISKGATGVNQAAGLAAWNQTTGGLGPKTIGEAEALLKILNDTTKTQGERDAAFIEYQKSDSKKGLDIAKLQQTAEVKIEEHLRTIRQGLQVTLFKDVPTYGESAAIVGEAAISPSKWGDIPQALGGVAGPGTTPAPKTEQERGWAELSKHMEKANELKMDSNKIQAIAHRQALIDKSLNSWTRYDFAGNKQ